MRFIHSSFRGNSYSFIVLLDFGNFSYLPSSWNDLDYLRFDVYSLSMYVLCRERVFVFFNVHKISIIVLVLHHVSYVYVCFAI